MIIDIGKIEDSVMPFRFSAEGSELDIDTPGFRLIGPTAVVGEVAKHIGRIEVSGNIIGEAEVDCTRCLQPIRRTLNVDFDVDYLTDTALGSDGEVELQEADLGTDELADNKLDLIRLTREQILLSLPEQEFCKDDCKGLCEKCGANLNLIDCSCGDNEVDPRWAALKNLKNNY